MVPSRGWFVEAFSTHHMSNLNFSIDPAAKPRCRRRYVHTSDPLLPPPPPPPLVDVSSTSSSSSSLSLSLFLCPSPTWPTTKMKEIHKPLFLDVASVTNSSLIDVKQTRQPDTYSCTLDPPPPPARPLLRQSPVAYPTASPSSDRG